MSEKLQIPKFPEPYWRDHVNFPSFKKLDCDIECEVAIVGGGITGITTAYLLSQKGVKVTLIEASEIMNGTTGHTTAKITAQHGLIYDQLINDLGKEQAQLYYDANKEALEFIKNTVSENEIECDFTTEDAYVYASTDEYAQKIQDELRAYQKLGIPGDYVDSIPFDIKCKAAIIMKDQAQFHPLKYLMGLIEKITEAGGKIYEHTTAMKIDDSESPMILTKDQHTITAKHIVVASHFPFNDEQGLYFARMHAERSYVLAIKAKDKYPGGMYISADNPSRSLRSVTINGETMILVGGEKHKPGQGIPTIQHYEALQQFSEEVFDVVNIPYRWSAQDLITLDKIPYIGPATSNKPHILISTGYAKWGMTNGTIAALLLTDIILEKENRYAELFTPSRFNAKPGIKNFLIDNSDVAKHLIQGKFAIIHKEIDDLHNDEGAIVKVNGDKAAVYRDTEGTCHIVDSTCTHMGCEVEWNSGDRTWDCPCHASRFSITGEVLEGPAVEPLRKIDFD